MRHLLFPSFVAVFLCCFSGQVNASGYSDPVNIGSRAIGLGGAFVGIANDPSAIYHNPAGVSLLKGHQVEAGFDANLVNFKFTPPGGTIESSKVRFTPAPFLFYTQEVNENMSLGIGLYFPHGNVVKYSTPSANILNPTEVSFYSMEITPVVSVNLPQIKGLSLGMGFRFVRISSSVKNQGFVLSTSPLTIDNLETIDLSAWTMGAVLGAMYKPVEWGSIGLVYHSPLEADLDGNGKFTGLGKFKGTVSQVIPGMLTAGVGLYPIKKLTVGFQYDYEQNAQNSQTDLNLSVFPGIAVLPLSWKNSHTIHIGASYDWNESFNTSVGYARDLNKTIQPQSSDRGNTDFDGHFVCAGVGMHYRKFDINAAWKVFFGDNFVQNNGVNPVPGKYKLLTNTVSTSVAYKF